MTPNRSSTCITCTKTIDSTKTNAASGLIHFSGFAALPPEDLRCPPEQKPP
jgi:hypothetical protein